MTVPLWSSHDMWLNGGWLGSFWHLCASWLHDPVFFGSRTAVLYIYCSVYLLGGPQYVYFNIVPKACPINIWCSLSIETLLII